jgi:hypothetical protein
MEVSTGLFADCVMDKGSWNGESYEYVAQNIRADHLAILPDSDGACSVKDGAGLLVNQETQQTEMPTTTKEQSMIRIMMILNQNYLNCTVKRRF